MTPTPTSGRKPGVSLRGRVAGNTAWGFGAELASKGALFLVTLYLAKVLGAEQFGEFALLQTIFMFLWMGVDLGLNLYATREIARKPEATAEFFFDFLMMRATLATVLTVAALAGVAYWGGDRARLWLALGFGLYLVVRAIEPDWLLRGREQFRELALVNAIAAVVLLLAAVNSIDGPDDLAVAALPWLWCHLIATAGIIVVLKRQRVPLRPASWALRPLAWLDHWQQSVHFTLSSGVSTLYQNIPLLYVYGVATAEVTGVFAAPFRATIALIFVASVFPMAIYPVFADLHQRSHATSLTQLLRWSAGLVAVLASGAGTVVWILAEPLMGLLGTEYEQSAAVLRWMVVFFVLRSVRAVFVRMVCAAGHERRYSVVAAASVAVLCTLLAVCESLGVDPLLSACLSLTACEGLVVIIMAVLAGAAVNARGSGHPQQLQEPAG